jgi:cytosine/adenosine deaminase-related metal-dependent hydrolase
MADLLIRDGYLVTMDGDRRVIDDGAVAITDGRIVAVGTSNEVAAAHPARQIISARHQAIMPGFVDVHAHAGHGLVKTMGSGSSDRWTEAVETIYPRGSTPAFWEAEAELSALERLRAGVTTGLSIFGAYGSRTDDPAFADGHARAYARVGVRNVLAVGASPPPYPNRFVAKDGKAIAVPLETQLAVSEDVAKRWHGADQDRTRIMMCAPVWWPGRPGASDELSGAYRDTAEQVRALSKRVGWGFTQDGHQKGTVRAARQAGLLGPDALFSHCVDIEADEIAAIATSGTKVAHNPSANMSIRGYCPVPALLDAGASVAIGSDGTAPDRSYDMFRHMWQAMHYHRTHHKDSGLLPPGKVLEMVTCDAARCLGMEALVGSLEPGKAADVILVDLRRPHLYPPTQPLYRLTCFAVGSDVATAIVGGRVLMQDRRVLTVDEDAVLDRAAAETTAMLARTGLHAMLETPAGFWKATRYA